MNVGVAMSFLSLLFSTPRYLHGHERGDGVHGLPPRHVRRQRVIQRVHDLSDAGHDADVVAATVDVGVAVFLPTWVVARGNLADSRDDDDDDDDGDDDVSRLPRLYQV